MINNLQWQNGKLLENRFNHQYLTSIAQHCENEQQQHAKKITLIALTVLAVNLTVFCAFSASPVTAIVASAATFLLTLWALPKIILGLPLLDPYSRVKTILQTPPYDRTHADLEFIEFADNKGILKEKTVLEAHQLFTEHKMFDLKIARTQLHTT